MKTECPKDPRCPVYAGVIEQIDTLKKVDVQGQPNPERIIAVVRERTKKAEGTPGNHERCLSCPFKGVRMVRI